VVAETRRITAATDLPLLVDVDTGFGDGLGIARTVREMTRAGAAGVHLEDQVAAKRCGHRLGKALVSGAEMEDRIRAAVAARGSGDLLIMARTDALAVEGLVPAVERARGYAAAGADAIFFEAARELGEYARVAAAVDVPLLANITEFGVSPLFTLAELHAHGVAMVLYPLTAFRAMSHAAQRAYRVLRAEGTQRSLLDELQPRSELYRVLNYEAYERQMDALLGRRRGADEEQTEDPDEQD
jgi:methylisocitrate lyase